MLRTALKRYPILSNSVIYGTLYVGAEFSQQIFTRKILVDKRQDIDKQLLGRYAVIGTGAMGPMLTVWYRWLDKKFVGTATKTIVNKLLLDQFLLSPQLLIIFFVGMSLLERKPDIFEECSQKIIPTFKTSCLFWLPAQTLNFLLIPPTYRVIYVGSCAFAWVNILCYIKRQQY